MKKLREQLKRVVKGSLTSNPTVGSPRLNSKKSQNTEISLACVPIMVTVSR